MTPPPTLQELIATVREDAGSDQPLDQLVAAAATAADLEDTTDALLGYFVDRCRRDGRSWSEISNALGVTKQAVHKRFAPALAAHIIAATPAPTFERFTDRARHVVAASRQAALSLGADAVGTEHVLLALFAEPEGIAGRTLTAMNVTEDGVRAALLTARGHGHAQDGEQHSAPDEQAGDQAAAEPASQAADSVPPYADDAKRLLRDALTVALEFGHNYIGTEHLLLGLYRNPDSTAAWILGEAGALESTARTHVTDLLRQLRLS
ncbi:MAG TPA: Clp protease N-terminal domain-containing protein [Streptosporangiaceae bacterium]|nr:Clp protease N-terminal domain-containing protein [Streptosporangiaceae bacterium]